MLIGISNIKLSYILFIPNDYIIFVQIYRIMWNIYFQFLNLFLNFISPSFRCKLLHLCTEILICQQQKYSTNFLQNWRLFILLNSCRSYVTWITDWEP
jgi:hypothetical protein